MMKVTNYKANQTLIETQDYTAHLSYGVPQVVVFHRGSALENTVVHNNAYCTYLYCNYSLNASTMVYVAQ